MMFVVFKYFSYFSIWVREYLIFSQHILIVTECIDDAGCNNNEMCVLGYCKGSLRNYSFRIAYCYF